jgi:hypothetical protein
MRSAGAIMTDKNDIDEMRVWSALHHLECKYWYDVDFNGGRSAHEFYQHDGLYTVGQNRFEGRDGIKMFYDWRRRRGEVTTRHFITNTFVITPGERRAKMVGSMTIYRSRGSPPLGKTDGPILIADFTSDCVRGDDDVWRYASHIVNPVFVDSDAPFSLSVDPGFLAAGRVSASANSHSAALPGAASPASPPNP